MADDTSARLDLPYLAAGQLQKHVTLNEALTRLDALVQTAVLSRTTTAQPTSPDDGDLYIRPAGATGADWATRPAGTLLRAETGAWTVVPVSEGMIATVLDDEEVVVRHGAAWQPIAAGPTTALQNLTRLGLGTTADATNPLSVKLNKALWTALETSEAGDGDLRMTFNKQTAADVLSLLFQTGYGGRAELGLIGDDDLRLKVSADGSAWHDAFAVDRATGRASFPRGAARAETVTITASGDYAVPAWARRLEVVAVGGGGGGGSGSAGAAGTSRFGGGGGGAAGMSLAAWATADLAATLQIVIGTGGAGGAGVASGNGLGGATGVASTVAGGGATILTGAGGQGGLGGTASAGTGGAGGPGSPVSNRGGDSATAATAMAGTSLSRPDGSGGGGGGGGLNTTNTARAGGAGGAGAALEAVAAGGGGGTAAIGGAGGVSASPDLTWAAGGGGGGGAVASGAGFAGGAGANGGAGGGGGGAGSTGSGAGGAGGRGLVRLTAIG